MRQNQTIPKSSHSKPSVFPVSDNAGYLQYDLNKMKSKYFNWNRRLEPVYWIHEIKNGFSFNRFDSLKYFFGVNKELLSEITDISLSTLHRRKKSEDRFSQEESERIYRLLKLWIIAIEVFEDANRVQRWFSSPQKVFENKTPLEYADTLPGCEEIERVLRRIEHGIVL